MKKLSKEELKELYKKYSSKNLNMSLDEQLYEMFKIVKESDKDSFEDFRIEILNANNINEYEYYTKNINPDLKNI